MEVVLLIYVVVEFVGAASRSVWGLVVARMHGVHYGLVGLALKTFPQVGLLLGLVG